MGEQAQQMKWERSVAGRQEREVSEAERGRCFRKEGLVGVSHTAEVFCQAKTERVLCLLGLAVTLDKSPSERWGRSQAEVGLEVNGK